VAALVYGAIVLSSIAVQYSQLERQSKLHEAELRTSLAQAESAVLRAQLDPHFLMNSLHSIAALVRVQQTTGAVQMLSDLGDLLRESHTRTGTEYASIADEVEFARRYLAIEQVRFQDRLVVRWTVDPQTVEAIVPRLILQPIAENAIRHGIAQRSAAGRIDIRVHRVNDTLILTVTDDGPGPQTNAPLTDGVGLSVTRTRLTRAYGDAGSVTLRRSEGGGAIAEVRVPFQTVVASGRPG
jgi:two-component system LytT family sensor kinase